jgi:hypothetical protein
MQRNLRDTLDELEGNITALSDLRKHSVSALERLVHDHRSVLDAAPSGSFRDADQPLLPPPHCLPPPAASPTVAACVVTSTVWDLLVVTFFHNTVVPTFSRWHARLDVMDKQLSMVLSLVRTSTPRLSISQRSKKKVALCVAKARVLSSIKRDAASYASNLALLSAEAFSEIADAEKELAAKAHGVQSRTARLSSAMAAQVQQLGLRVHQQRGLTEAALAAQWALTASCGIASDDDRENPPLDGKVATGDGGPSRSLCCISTAALRAVASYRAQRVNELRALRSQLEGLIGVAEPAPQSMTLMNQQAQALPIQPRDPPRRLSPPPSWGPAAAKPKPITLTATKTTLFPAPRIDVKDSAGCRDGGVRVPAKRPRVLFCPSLSDDDEEHTP